MSSTKNTEYVREVKIFGTPISIDTLFDTIYEKYGFSQPCLINVTKVEHVKNGYVLATVKITSSLFPVFKGEDVYHTTNIMGQLQKIGVV